MQLHRATKRAPRAVFETVGGGTLWSRSLHGLNMPGSISGGSQRAPLGALAPWLKQKTTASGYHAVKGVFKHRRHREHCS